MQQLVQIYAPRMPSKTEQEQFKHFLEFRLSKTEFGLARASRHPKQFYMYIDFGLELLTVKSKKHKKTIPQHQFQSI
jgi:hypothetical protein